MLRWPVVSGRAIARLFRRLQDVDIFVEDQGDETFYTQLFRAAADDGVRILQVVGLGGRENVIAAARSYSETRPALFLIDGDLSWVRGDAAPLAPRLHRLNAYCIENTIINQAAIESLVAEECVCNDNDACELIGFSHWRDEVSVLVPLFVRFSVLNETDPTQPTVGRGALGNLLGGTEGPSVCPEKVAARIAEVEQQIVDIIGADEAHIRIRDVQERVDRLDDPLLAVSGKHFLMPLIFFRMKRASGQVFRHSVMRYRLARKCSREHLGELATALAVAG